MREIILDIETKENKDLVSLYTEELKPPKNYKDEEKIKEWRENAVKEAVNDMKLDLDYCDIVCIGWRESGVSEHISLEELDKRLTSLFRDTFRLITYNGKSFDIPIIIRHLLRKGLKNNVYDLKKSCKKFSDYPQVDLMELINEFGKWKGLDELSKIYLGKGEKPIDFATATEEEIKEHNLECLETTENLFNFFKPLI
jgi:DNA polymerase elongation subunit (family B)